MLQLWEGSFTAMAYKPGRLDWNHTLPQVVASGFAVIQSQGWYLNAAKLATNWTTMYMNEPLTNVTQPSEQRLVLGGEACMWAEYIDGSQLLNTMWPRAAAIAERLWSALSMSLGVSLFLSVSLCVSLRLSVSLELTASRCGSDRTSLHVIRLLWLQVAAICGRRGGCPTEAGAVPLPVARAWDSCRCARLQQSFSVRDPGSWAATRWAGQLSRPVATKHNASRGGSYIYQSIF